MGGVVHSEIELPCVHDEILKEYIKIYLKNKDWGKKDLSWCFFPLPREEAKSRASNEK